MAHAVNKKLSRTKRAKKFEGMLAITKQLTELADRALAFDKLTDVENATLKRQRTQLNDAIKALVAVFDAHDAHDPLHLGPVHLHAALAASFVIGSRAVQNPISRRLKKESAAHATRGKQLKSKISDDLIMNLIAPILKRQPNRQHSKLASDILDPLNEKLKLELARPLKLDTIQKKSTDSGLPYGRPANLRITVRANTVTHHAARSYGRVSRMNYIRADWWLANSG